MGTSGKAVGRTGPVVASATNLPALTLSAARPIARCARTKPSHEQTFLLLGPIHRVFDVFTWYFQLVDQKGEVRADNLADGRKVFLHVAGQLAVAVGRNRQLAGFTQHKGTAVRCSV